jgi:hypothetical protein
MSISVEGGGVRALRDALRTCLQIAGGLTEATRQRAVAAARELLDQAGVDIDTVQRRVSERIPVEVQSLADELVSAGKANRDLLIGLVREEADRAKERVGRLADELGRVGDIVDALERRVRRLEEQGEAASEAAAPPPPAAKKAAAAKKTAAKKTAAKKTAAKKTAAKKTAAKKTPAKKAAAKKQAANPKRADDE